MNALRSSPLRVNRGGALAVGIALASGCISSEDVDLGRNVDAGVTLSPVPPLPMPSPDGARPPSLPNCAAAPELPPWCDAGTADQVVPPLADVTVAPTADASMVAPPPVTDDAGSAGVGASFCIKNGSFEPLMSTVGMGMTGTTPMGPSPPDWALCTNFNLPTQAILPVIDPSSVCTMPASDGMDYVGLTVGSYGAITDASEALVTYFCMPFLAGTTYSISVDLAIAYKTLVGTSGVIPITNTSSGMPAVLELYAGKTPCGKDELLWTSPSITNQDAWKTYCGTFTPTQSAFYLTIVPNAPTGSQFAMGQWSYVVVDHLVTGTTCK